MLMKLERLLVPLTMLIVVDWTSSAPKTWPYMKTYDIWETNRTVDRFKERPTLVDSSHDFVHDNLLDGRKNGSLTRVKGGRKAKGELLKWILGLKLSSWFKAFESFCRDSKLLKAVQITIDDLQIFLCRTQFLDTEEASETCGLD